MIARRAVALGLLAAASAVQGALGRVDGADPQKGAALTRAGRGLGTGEFVERCLTSNTLTTPEKVRMGPTLQRFAPNRGASA